MKRGWNERRSLELNIGEACFSLGVLPPAAAAADVLHPLLKLTGLSRSGTSGSRLSAAPTFLLIVLPAIIGSSRD